LHLSLPFSVNSAAQRSQTFPASIFTSPSWWWIGQLCAVVPRLCYTAPQVDNSSLIEILCAELEQHKRSGGGYGASSRMRNENATRQRLRSSDNREDAVDAMFVRVRRRSMLPAIQPTPPMQIRADRQDNRKGNKHMSEDLTRRQSNERLEDSTPRIAIAVQSPSEEGEEEEEEEEKGAEDTDFYTDDDADSEEAEVSSRRELQMDLASFPFSLLRCISSVWAPFVSWLNSQGIVAVMLAVELALNSSGGREIWSLIVSGELIDISCP
uniref:Monocarboxylate transporter n=1 Tax=Schistocephalus solidus TaxID=70667 RepID=A0A183TM13_SCHSO